MKETIRQTYELFGFMPVETPTIEYSEVLLAKSGGETEKQIYRFTRGDNDFCLRYDNTVPLSRFVASRLKQISLPFRSYQIQKVFRAERPQKGRFREFYQCDIDIIGTKSMLADAEIPSVICAVFKKLGIDRFTIRLSNRKLLAGLLDSLGLFEHCTDILRLIDKIEKQGKESIANEMKTTVCLSDEAVLKIFEFINIKGETKEIISQLEKIDVKNDLFTEGLGEIKTLTENISALGVPETNYAIDLRIARGLDYYTGTIYETVLTDYPALGSVCSGGRYDNLASCYTDTALPGVGMSIGLTRLFDQLRSVGFFNFGKATASQILVARTNNVPISYAIKITSSFRESGIPTEMYLENAPLGKQLKYADKLGIPFVIIIGTNEGETEKEGKVILKNMTTGEQKTLSPNEVIATMTEFAG